MSTRWHALDALRGLAMLLGVVLHAAVAYMPHAMPGLVWATRDPSASPFFDHLFWALHAFRLPLFFALAGFFAAVLCDGRGAGSYLDQRTRRLLLPLIAFGLVVLPLTFVVWAWGWLGDGLCTANEIRRVKFAAPLQASLKGPAHLWFLEYLYLMCLIYAVFRRLRGGLVPVRLSVGPAPRWWPLLPAAVAAPLLALDPGAVCHFHNAFLPQPTRFAYYAVFFGAGVVLARARLTLDRTLGPRAALWLAPCLPLLVAEGFLVRRYLDDGLGVGGRIAFGVVGALVASLALYGLLGLGLRLWRREVPVLRHLANSSYWIYLIHFPLVGLAHVLLAKVAAPAAIKFAVATAGPVAIGLWSYNRFVAGRWLGVFLNGAPPTPHVPTPAVRLDPCRACG